MFGKLTPAITRSISVRRLPIFQSIFWLVRCCCFRYSCVKTLFFMHYALANLQVILFENIDR